MSRKSCIAGLTTLVLTAKLFVASALAELAAVPDERWTPRAEPANCSVERLGRLSSAAMLVQTVPGSDAFTLAVATGSLQSRSRDRLAPATLRFNPSGETLSGMASASKLPNGSEVVRMTGLPPALLDRLAEAASISLEAKAVRAGPLPLANTSEAMAALRRCMADRLIEWGADPAQFTPTGALPVALTPRDEWVPNGTLLAITGYHDEMRAIFRVSISRKGQVDGCVAVEGAAGSAEKLACDAVLRRSLFKPARDGAGRPVSGVATFQVTLFRRPN